MADILEYKCPCCGGAITFNSSIQKMKCPYCDTEFEMDTLKEFEEEWLETDREPQWDSESVERPQEELKEEEGSFAAYVCEACGGEIVADQTMAASSCPFCGNPVIVMKKLSGVLRPDLVIPFRLDKESAKERLKNHLKGKLLLPALFKTENRIEEVKGIYVPFWLYVCDAHAEIRCRATRVNTWETGNYIYTETKHYLVSRAGEIGFEKVPADGSKKMDDALMQSIEPFDFREAVDFQTAYLSGYLADKYDLSSAECEPYANERMRQSTVNAFLSTIAGYATCVPEHTDIQLKQGKIRYALLPVWLLNTKYRGRLYTFAMNGQTGKFVGDLPADRIKGCISYGVSFSAVFLITYLITLLF